MKNLPDFSYIEDTETREYCENNFVNDETLDMLREDGNVLRPWREYMLVYNINDGIYLHHDPIDK